MRRFGARGVFGVMLAGALMAAVLGSGPLAEWGDSHIDQPGGETLSAALHGWDDIAGPAGQPRTWLRAWSRRLLDAKF